MTRRSLVVLVVIGVISLACAAQELNPKWEELTAPDFVKAIAQSKNLCLLPFGIVEKHGPSGPLGTDLLNVRYLTLQAVKQEYAVVFPEYYFGQIFEARQQPGTLAYSTELQLKLLTETMREMSRNGCKKILIVNGHGGNTNLINYFAQTQLDSPKDYIVYAFSGLGGNQADVPAAARASKPGVDGHAGEGEESNVMASRPDLVHPERAGEESGANLRRLDLPTGVFTAIFWYASFPNHYQGDAAGANAARGAASIEFGAQRLANAIRAVKADQSGPRLQKEFFDAAQHPLDTKQ